jgi:hypothetical protein
METTAVVTLALLAWLLLPLPLAVACGRAFDLGSRSDERLSHPEPSEAPRSPRV